MLLHELSVAPDVTVQFACTNVLWDDTFVYGHKCRHSLAPCGAVSIFDSESIIFNLSEGICDMKADANSNKRGKKQHNSSEKARANPCSDAIITHNQIRADLNRHRTQNHIKQNWMCMALHCSQSPLFSLPHLCSLFRLFTLLLHFFPHLLQSVSITKTSHDFSMPVTWKIRCQWLTRFLRLLWADSLFSVVSPETNSSCHRRHPGSTATDWSEIQHTFLNVQRKRIQCSDWNTVETRPQLLLS